jgi:hypothetical protein
VQAVDEDDVELLPPTGDLPEVAVARHLLQLDLLAWSRGRLRLEADLGIDGDLSRRASLDKGQTGVNADLEIAGPLVHGEQAVDHPSVRHAEPPVAAAV